MRSRTNSGLRFIGVAAARIGIIAALVSGTVFVSAQPGMAASCSGSACTGKNPSSTGCSTAGVSVKQEVSKPKFTYQLRYSSTCKAFWARTVRDDLVEGQCPLIYSKIVQQRSEYSQADSVYKWVQSAVKYETSEGGQCNGGTQFTYMIADSSATEREAACYVTAYSTTRPTKGWQCTGWYIN